MHYLISWIGKNDILGAYCRDHNKTGAVVSILKKFGKDFDRLLLLNSYSLSNINGYIKDTGKQFEDLSGFEEDYKWILKEFSKAEVCIKNILLSSPIDFVEIYNEVTNVLKLLKQESAEGLLYTYNMTSGTPAMIAIWLLVGKSIYHGKLLQTSEFDDGEAKSINIPFDIWTDYLPEIRESRDIFSDTDDIKTFDSISTKSSSIINIKKTASLIAKDDCAVLIYGETGTGKELFARAIHKSSLRAKENFIAINCGAIPEDLLESELFGHRKGSFTGAVSDKKGLFKIADKGTIFLDEIGDMPLSLQVKLLRVLQEGKFRPIGEHKDQEVDVRIISATNKNLLGEIENKCFREDLYFRIAQFILGLPPLRERKQDIQMLADMFLKELNEKAKKNISNGLQPKKFKPNARKLLDEQTWRGNIRELKLVIRRVFLMANLYGKDIEDSILKECLTPEIKKDLLDMGLDLPINLDNTIEQIEKQLVLKAWDSSGHVLKNAASMLGFSNYQRLQSLLKKYKDR